MDKEYRTAIELVSNVFDAYTAALFLFDRDRNRLEVAAWHTLSKNFSPETTLSPGDGIVGWVAKNGRPVNVTHFDQDTGNLVFYSQNEEIKSFMAVPVGDEGVLCIDSKSKYVFVEKDQKILAGMAEVLLDLARAVRTRRREKAYAKMLKLLYQVDKSAREMASPGRFLAQVLGAIKDFARADVCFFTSVRQDRRRYRVDAVDGRVAGRLEGLSFGLESGLVGWVYRKNQPLVIKSIVADGSKSYLFEPGDPVRGFKSFIGLPLQLWGETVGVLGMAAFDGRNWSADEIHILTMSGQWAATALGSLTN